jgi:Tol biopolymer transport system component
MLKSHQKIFAVCLSAVILASSGCQQAANLSKPTVSPASLRDVPAQRLGYRYEPDAPAPPEQQNVQAQEKLTAVQADFDQNRATDSLLKTVLSSDKQRALAVYQRAGDEKEEYRLDLYDAGGKLVRKVSPDALALVFPEMLAWSPDGGNFAFVGSRRISAPNEEIVQEAPIVPSLEGENANANSAAAPIATPIVAATSGAKIEAFTVEQIYLASREGTDLRRVSVNPNLIYYYFAWSPDGAMLAALACKENEWNGLQMQTAARGEIFHPFGRPRLIEKSGRERLLDDNLTDVSPVWSPDSAKLATAYSTNVRIYDAASNVPTSASIPLQVPLLTSSQAYDAELKRRETATATTNTINTNSENVAAAPTNQVPVSYNPIVALRWTEDNTLYLQTGFAKDYAGGEIRRSFMRWHKLNLSSQAQY